MNKGLLSLDRSIAIILFSVYLFYIGYFGYHLNTDQLEQSKNIFLSQQVLAGIILLYGIYLFFSN
tara:strand:- start:607 stop:801 length:195 start_codon:yes stop_codon:yes gene_type:complete